MKEFNSIMFQLVTTQQETTVELAKSINKSYATLMREINPHDKGAKLGVETVFQLMQLTKDTTPLEYLADQLGFTLVDINDSSQDVKGNTAP